MAERTLTLQQISILMGSPSDELVSQWESSEGAARRTSDVDEALHRSWVAQVLVHRSDEVAKRWSARKRGS